MAQLPAPFTALTVNLHTQEPPPAYALTPGRWDVYDLANMKPDEPLERFRLRGLYAAQHWAQEDASATPAPAPAPPAPVRSRGRPPVYPRIPGESPESRRARLTRERLARTKGTQPAHKLHADQLTALLRWAWEQGGAQGEAPTLEAALEALNR